MNMLEKTMLELILHDWNEGNQADSKTIPRETLRSHIRLQPDIVLVIQGVRRCGKSTLLAQIMTTLRLSPSDCTFVNFEDPRLSNELHYTLLDQIIQLRSEKKPKDKPLYFFFDEIQNVEGWQKWLRLHIDRPTNAHFVITGSNASLFSGELGSTLTGRHMTLELFPFSFHEFRLAQPNASLEDYLQEGGFPRALTYENPQQLLREYFRDIIERDVRRHVAARSSLALSRLVKAVFESTGSEVSRRSLAGLLGVSVDTIGIYLDACELSYMILPCPYFTFSERQQTARNRKYYPIDLGLRNAVITKTGRDRGKNLETIIFHHLRQKSRHVYYWRKKGEVDLVTMTEEGITPYQISWDGPKERHYKALEEFAAEFPQARSPVFVSRENAINILEL